jgi:hypothetical protein
MRECALEMHRAFYANKTMSLWVFFNIFSRIAKILFNQQP